MKRSISCDSFFFNGKTVPLIRSYGKFLNYANSNNIKLTKNIRKFAMLSYFKYLNNEL